MKRIVGRILTVLLFLAVFFGSLIGSFFLFRDNTTKMDSKYLAVFDEGDEEYYLQKADKDITFYVDSTEDSDYGSLFELSDAEGKKMDPSVKRVRSGQFRILPPSGGYEEGSTYTLALNEEAVFSGEELKPVRTLVFCIEREAIEKYTYTDSVHDFKKEEITALSDSVIELPGDGLQAGDIVVGQNSGDEYIAYKITELLDNNSASVEQPALEEIYDELEVYGEYVLSIDDIVSNPDLEVEIIENVRNSSFYDSLVTTAYAEETKKDLGIDVKIKNDKKENTLEIEIKFSIEPGKKGLFGIKQLQKQAVSLTLSAKFEHTARCNIKGIVNWDVASISSIGYSWAIDITPYTDEWKNDASVSDIFKDKASKDKLDYKKIVGDIVKALNKIKGDKADGELKLFTWDFPIPGVPGLIIDIDIKVYVKFEIAVSLGISKNVDTVCTTGLSFINYKFRNYYNVYKSEEGIDVSLKGKAEFKAGLKLDVKVSLLKVVELGVDPQTGFYAELYITWPINKSEDLVDENFLYSYFEPGLYYSADFKASLNLLFKKFEYKQEIVEKKFPFTGLTLGNAKIACNITTNIQSVRAIDNTVIAPDIIFEFYDVKKGRMDAEILSADKIKFVTSDSTLLKLENRKLQIPITTTSSNLFITATYLHTDGMTYSAVFRVLISGSTLEGKVSAYSGDISASAINGATVNLFSQANSSTPIGTAATGEDGRFAFNVSAGDYRIVISADGYKTLTSSQSVAEDEIKYTEHILLIDEGQTGIGQASGIVSNALDGMGVSGAKIMLRENWNNESGAYVGGFAASTDSYGHYYVTDVPSGYYTVEASLNSYVTGYANIIVLEEDFRTDYDFTITPILSEDEIRIVLSWGEIPSDLDSHLIGLTPSGDAFNVFYDAKEYWYNNVEMANLDVDDITSYGPETITNFEDIQGTYTYAVHNYSDRSELNSVRLSNSGAVVKVYQGSTRIAEYHVPTDQIGTYWTVFEIDHQGNIIPVNSISNTKPSA